MTNSNSFTQSNSGGVNFQNQINGGEVNQAKTINIGGPQDPTSNNPDSSEDNSEAPNKILFLAANPKATTQLLLDKELREIDESLRRGKNRDQFSLTSRWAVRIEDFYRTILDVKPKIIHFAGHGSGDQGLVLQDDQDNVDFLSKKQLDGYFKLFAKKGVKCVLLNACYSEIQAKAIQKHIPYVIGMDRSITDEAALKFAVAFYDGLVTNEENIEEAFELGYCRLIGSGKEDIPQLLKQADYKEEAVAQVQEVSNSPSKASTETHKEVSESSDEVDLSRFWEVSEDKLLEDIGDIVRSPVVTERELEILQISKSDTEERTVFEDSITVGQRVLTELSPKAYKLLCSPIEGDNELAQELTKLMDKKTQESAKEAAEKLGYLLMGNGLGLSQRVTLMVSSVIIRKIASGTSDFICGRWEETLGNTQ